MSFQGRGDFDGVGWVTRWRMGDGDDSDDVPAADHLAGGDDCARTVFPAFFGADGLFDCPEIRI